MADAVLKISKAIGAGRKNLRDPSSIPGKRKESKHGEEVEDIVDISDEAKRDANQKSNPKVTSYFENKG